MFDILSIIPGRKKATGSGWTTFNAVCCIHFGHKADRRGRGGIIIDGSNFTYHCFNCGFKARFTLGKRISANVRKLLGWCGEDDAMIQKWSLESLQHKDILNVVPVKKVKRIKFQDKKLPAGELIDPENPLHKKYIDYLQRRGINHYEYPFIVTPNEIGRQGNKITLPYTHGGRVVGHISRFLDDKIPKYIKEQQVGYVFGFDLQKPEWSVCILTEGIFDAISLNTCALTHDDISPEQASLLTSINKPIIFVPHQDKTGLAAIDKALELGYQISLPNWEPGIKDINEAVVAYGRLPTLLSILHSATTSLIKIELKRKQLAKRL
jgi:hypothetical protein